jgi:hypothetical protein
MELARRLWAAGYDRTPGRCPWLTLCSCGAFAGERSGHTRLRGGATVRGSQEQLGTWLGT